MKSKPTFGMIFRFSNEISRADAAALLRNLRRHRRPVVMEAGAYFVDSLILRTR